MAWRVARSLQTLIEEVERKYPGTTFWTIGDQDHASRSSDHNPNAAGVVTAVDVVGVTQARALWKFLREVRDPRMKYQIHDRKIMSSTINAWSARTYTGSNPHTTHLHLSVGRGSDGNTYRSDLYDDPSPWGFSPLDQEDDSMLTRGDTGLGVKLMQKALITEAELSGRANGNPLPNYGADGDFGGETEDAVKAYQRAADIPVTGRIDGLTSAFLARYTPNRHPAE